MTNSEIHNTDSSWWTILSKKRLSNAKISWNRQCQWCGVGLLKSEENGWCCSKGKFILPPLPPYPEILSNSFESYNQVLSSLSRKLNNLFAFTSISVSGGFQHLPTPSNVAITGRIYHQIRDLSTAGHSLQWFLYDESARQTAANEQQVPLELVISLHQALNEINPFVHHLRAAFNSTNIEHLTLELHTSVAGGEIAAIIHGNNLHQVHPRGVLIQQNGHSIPQKIDILSSLYEPLQYPVFFPHGTQGWSPEAMMSQIRWYRSRMLSEVRFQQFGRLAGEYLVDMYSRVEDERLSYIRRALIQQQELRNLGSLNHTHASGILDHEFQNSSRGVILPSSFLGSRAWAASEVADSLAICRSRGKPSFFITITTNPNWTEITEKLRPGQTASDIPVIVCRVFKAKMGIAVQAIRKHFGSVVYIVRVVEFQKRGLPHAHIVVKVLPLPLYYMFVF